MTNTFATDFEEFLKLLDPDRERAAGRYIALRERVEKFFEWRDCEMPEELADTVFDRVAKKIGGGEKIENAEAYCVSVAKFVLLENRREVLRREELDEDSLKTDREADRETSAAEDEDKKLKCLDQCLAGFSAEKRKLLIDYFDTDEETMIPARQRLSKKLGINLNSLRIRVCRLKSKLEKCTRDCCEA
ncbi:MAG: hypothetical protein R2747_17820 [Pyrinomonadaceae bacterium]